MIVGVITVNVADARSPVLPLTVMSMGPAEAPAFTVNAPVIRPAEIVHVPTVMNAGVPASDAQVSVSSKPLPVTDT